MKFETVLLNELPFMIELQDGNYEVKTTSGTITLTMNSDWYKLHTARFTEFAGKTTYLGDKETLQNLVQTNGINNYAFGECKTFVSCRFSKEITFSEDDFDAVTEEQCIEKIKTLMLRQGVNYESTDHLHTLACEERAIMEPEQVKDIKNRILIRNEFGGLHRVYDYYEALNNLIKQYAYIRGLFWTEKLDENILSGTIMQDYLDGKQYDSVTFAGLAQSILPYKRVFPDLETEKLEELKNRLQNNTEIAAEEELISVARSLWYRLEFRSAVIESSAALEIAVEKKLIEKMTANGMSQQNIETELRHTETNFRQRCDYYLERYTGKSFEKDNPTLWATIDGHRKTYRHKIAHSTVMPDKKKTEDIIKDFEQAISYINSL